MTRMPVTSSAIAAIGHDPDTNTLEVEMSSGQVYRYADVHPKHFEALLGAESIGKHFHRHIKCGGFAFTKVESAPEESI